MFHRDKTHGLYYEPSICFVVSLVGSYGSNVLNHLGAINIFGWTPNIGYIVNYKSNFENTCSSYLPYRGNDDFVNHPPINYHNLRVTIGNGSVRFERVETEPVWNCTFKFFWNLNRTELKRETVKLFQTVKTTVSWFGFGFQFRSNFKFTLKKFIVSNFIFSKF